MPGVVGVQAIDADFVTGFYVAASQIVGDRLLKKLLGRVDKLLRM